MTSMILTNKFFQDLHFFTNSTVLSGCTYMRHASKQFGNYNLQQNLWTYDDEKNKTKQKVKIIPNGIILYLLYYPIVN